MNTGLLVLVDKVHQRLLEGPDGVLGSGIERVKVDTAIVVLVGASVDILVFAQVDLGKVVEAISYLFNGILNDLEGRDVLELVCLMQSVDVVSMMDLMDLVNDLLLDLVEDLTSIVIGRLDRAHGIMVYVRHC